MFVHNTSSRRIVSLAICRCEPARNDKSSHLQIAMRKLYKMTGKPHASIYIDVDVNSCGTKPSSHLQIWPESDRVDEDFAVRAARAGRYQGQRRLPFGVGGLVRTKGTRAFVMRRSADIAFPTSSTRDTSKSATSNNEVGERRDRPSCA